MDLYRLNCSTINLFKAVVLKDGKALRSPELQDCQTSAVMHGVVFDPEAFVGRSLSEARELMNYAVTKYGVNMAKVNSTFYKRFSDVESRSELQLRLEQLLHYMSTYGRGIDREDITGYEPEYLKEVEIDVEHDLTYIGVLSVEELADKVKAMLTSGMALNEETQDDLMVIIEDCNLPIQSYLDQINNREIMCRLCKKFGLLPKNFDEFTRYLIYLGTGSTLLIKSRSMLAQLNWLDGFAYKRLEKAFNQYVNQFGVEMVAHNVTRYRKLYLVLRKHFTDKTIINRALKLSKRLYVPRKQSPLEHVMDLNVPLDKVQRSIGNAPIYKLIKIMNALMRYEKQDARYFKIRNGKSYLKLNDRKRRSLIEWTSKMARNTSIQEMIRSELKHRYGGWDKKIFYIPKGINYAVPTSGKDFVGTLPYMSSYEFKGKDVSLGVAWDTQADLDLHMMSLDGEHFGWNASHSGTVTFSGDMTHLNPVGYAAEFYKVKANELTSPMIVSVNDYWSQAEVKFDVFVTGASVDTYSKQGVATQIGAKSVLFHASVTPEEPSKTLMIVLPTKDGVKVGFVATNYGNTHVPGVDNATLKLIEIIRHQLDHTYMITDLIKLLGGQVVSDEDELEKLDFMKYTHNTQVVTKNGQAYVNFDFEAPEIINLSPDKLTQSTFTDLLKEPEGADNRG